MSSSTSANDSISSEAAVAMAAVMGLRQQHLNAAAVANQHHSEPDLTNFNLRSGKQSKYKIMPYSGIVPHLLPLFDFIRLSLEKNNGKERKIEMNEMIEIE